MLDFSVTFVFTLINIFVLFVILRLILFKPVTRFMEKRARAIAADLEHAESEKAQAKSLLQNYEARVKNVRAEAEAIIRDAREEARKQADKIVADGRAEARGMLENARRQVEAEHSAALAAFQSEAAALVVMAAGRLLQRELTAEDSLRQAELLLQGIGKN
ncbi:MAG: ATP synthase F0 subunit B [Spirochaetales bacterium]|jgi:F-type H+-transporting ATPase subunit b|nr:ATP synthase F0 subunit B [Spirochaetales bacterium]